ncbi:MAG: DUF1080 domain-containing protein [Planctomycetaceae bacterium]|nr:DUF1080 domain-containing protein [Planctomycetaceae bacterium]
MNQTLLLRPFAGIFLVLAAIASPAVAQPREGNPEEGPAYIDPASTDEDYRFQGEYLGWTRFSRWGRETRSAGLHVMALGNGEFAATGYHGGLPGDGWFGGDRQLFEGARQGDVVELQGAGLQLVADGQTVRAFDAAGALEGEYRKVQRISPTMGALPPRGAIVLFDGSDTSRLVNAAVTPDGLLQSGTATTDAYGDFRMHAEFRLPYKPLGRGQNRGNSGLYLQGRYEVQILDTFGLEGVENECGALYRTRRPDINMCFPPLVWQTYDIDFVTPQFDADGSKLSDMRISVWHNGVLVHHQAAIPNKTGAGRPEGPEPLPTLIQDHRNPVMFRNVWLVEKPKSPTGAKIAAEIATPHSGGTIAQLGP